ELLDRAVLSRLEHGKRMPTRFFELLLIRVSRGIGATDGLPLGLRVFGFDRLDFEVSGLDRLCADRLILLLGFGGVGPRRGCDSRLVGLVGAFFFVAT